MIKIVNTNYKREVIFIKNIIITVIAASILISAAFFVFEIAANSNRTPQNGIFVMKGE